MATELELGPREPHHEVQKQGMRVRMEVGVGLSILKLSLHVPWRTHGLEGRETLGKPLLTLSRVGRSHCLCPG